MWCYVLRGKTHILLSCVMCVRSRAMQISLPAIHMTRISSDVGSPLTIMMLFSDSGSECPFRIPKKCVMRLPPTYYVCCCCGAPVTPTVLTKSALTTPEEVRSGKLKRMSTAVSSSVSPVTPRFEHEVTLGIHGRPVPVEIVIPLFLDTHGCFYERTFRRAS